MILKDEQIVDQLLKQTGLSRREIESHLAELKKHLSNIDDDERIELPELGEFIKTGESLRFVPSVELEAEINYKYAGMQPLEIVEANKQTVEPSTAEMPPDETEKPISSEEKTEDEQAIDAELTEEEDADGEIEVREDTEQGKSTETEDTKPTKKYGEGEREAELKKQQDKFTKSVKHEDNRAQPTEDDKQVDANKKQTEKDQPVLNSGNTKKSSKSRRKRNVYNPQDKSQKESIFSLLNTIIAIIIIGGIVFLIYKFDSIKENRRARLNQQTEQTQRPENEEQTNSNQATLNNGTGSGTPTGEDADTDTDSGSEKDISSESSASKPADQNAMKSSASAYGLYGNNQTEKPDGGYTIIVYSLKNKAAALNRQSTLSKNYRAFLLPYTLDSGDTSWRVGLGRFRTVDDALAAADSLKEPYKNNNFIKRISQ